MDGFDDEPRDSGASIAAPLIRALLAAAVAFGVYALVFAPGDPAEDVGLATVTETPTAIATVPPEPLTPTTAPEVIPTVAPPIETTDPAQPGEGVSAQVLNGTDDQELFDSVVQVLIDFGYDVTQSGRARTDYPETTIFATAGQEAAAQALADADPRFTVIGENPGNLTSEIDIHIVVGADWTVGAGAGDDASPSPTETSTEG